MPARKPASTEPEPARQRPWKKFRSIRGRRLWVLVAVAALAVVLVGVLLTSIQRPAPAPVETPSPVIPGQMGEHFKELEESVTP
jgi:hypothetical protein